MSDSIVLDLGQTELHVANEDISLWISSEVTLITSGKDGNSNAHTCGLTQHVFSDDVARKPWLQKGHQYRIVIDVQIAAELGTRDQTLAQVVADRLKDSKIWKSLGLEVTSVQIRPTDPDLISWALSLDYCSQGDNLQQRKLHKLMPDLPFRDTEPPPGVPTYRLQSVHLRMVLIRKHVPTACRTLEFAHSNGFAMSQNISHDPEMLFLEPRNGSEEPPCWDGDFDYCDLSGHGLLEESMSRVRSDSLIEQPISPSESYRKWVLPTPPSSQDSHVRTLYEQNLYDHVCCPDPGIAVLDVGLNYAMFGFPPRKRRNLTVVSSEGFKDLSSVAPSLWSPGYIHSVADRATFLPTLSHAVAGISQNSVTSNSLGTKVKELARRYCDTSDRQIIGDGLSPLKKAQDALNVTLWQLLASNLHDKGGAKWRQLLSNDVKPKDATNPCEVVEDMLDLLEASDESDFDDLLTQISEVGEEGLYDCHGQNDLGDTFVTSLAWSMEGAKTASGHWDMEDPTGCDPGSDLRNYQPRVHRSDQGPELFGTTVPGDARDLGSQFCIGVDPNNSSRQSGPMSVYDSSQIRNLVAGEDTLGEDKLKFQNVDLSGGEIGRKCVAWQENEDCELLEIAGEADVEAF